MTQGNWELNLEANVVFRNDTQLVGNTSLRDKRKQLRILFYHTFHFCVFIFRLIPSFCCVPFFFSVFIIFVFFMVSHDLRLCFLELVHFFCFVPQTFILQSIHTSRCKSDSTTGKNPKWRREGCLSQAKLH